MYRKFLILSLLICAASIFVSPKGIDKQGCGYTQNSSCFSLGYALNVSSFVELLPGVHFFHDISLQGKSNVSITGVAGTDNSSHNNQIIIDANHSRLFDISFSSVTITNIVIKNCVSIESGPALFVFNASITLVNCVIANCTASEGGGAIYAQASTLLVINSSFLNNTSENSYGGMIVIESGSITTFLNSYFIGNKCLLWGGAVVPEGDSRNTFYNCYFGYNVAGCCGGAIDDGAQSRNFYYNTTFEYNRAGEGGAYYNFAEAIATFEDSRFYRNQAASTAGGIYSVSFGGVNMSRTQFIENSARSGQDAIRSVNAGFLHMDGCLFTGHYGTQRFSMLSLRVLDTIIKNTTFINNTAATDFLINFVGGTVLLDQCNFSHNSGVWLIKADAIMNVDRSDLSFNVLTDSLFVVSSDGDLTLSGSSFYGNQASEIGAVVTVESDVGLLILNSSFINNNARTGGVLDIRRGANVTIESSLFMGNSAEKDGGVIFTEEVFLCRNSRFLNNSADRGGVIFISEFFQKPYYLQLPMSNSNNNNSSALAFANCSSWLQNCQLANSFAGEGGVILWEDRVICFDLLENCNTSNNNAVAFGPVVASAELAQLKIPQKRIEVYPGEPFSLEVLLQDDFQQIMTSSTVSAVNLVLENVSRAFLSPDYESAAKSMNKFPSSVFKGVAQFVDMMLFANVGEYQLLIKSDTNVPVVTILEVVVTDCPEQLPALSRDPVFACLLDNRFLRWEYLLLAILIALTVTGCLVYRASGKRSPIYWPPKLKLFLQEVALVWLTVFIELLDTITDIVLCVYSWVLPELQSVGALYAACFVLIVLSFVIMIYTNVRDLRILQKHIRESRAEEDKKEGTFTMHQVMRRRTTEATPARLPKESRNVAIARMEREKSRCLVRLLCGFLEDVPMGIISLRSVATLEEVPSVMLLSLVLNCILLGMKLGAFQRWRELSASLAQLKKLEHDEEEQNIAMSTLKKGSSKLTVTSTQQLAISLDLAEEKAKDDEDGSSI